MISVMSGRGTLMFWKYSLYVAGRLNVSPTKIMFVLGWVGSPVWMCWSVLCSQGVRLSLRGRIWCVASPKMTRRFVVGSSLLTVLIACAKSSDSLYFSLV